MTRGEMVFYAGVALLAATVILAIIFIVKKPRYVPGAYHSAPEETVRLRNAYPTDRLTKRYPHSQETNHSESPEQLPETELMQNSEEANDTVIM